MSNNFPVGEKSASVENSAIAASLPHLDIAACDGPVSFHRVANPLLEELISDSDDDDNDASKEGNENTYQCVFCNHIFKSHYCYQKVLNSYPI